jgi:hypothetical protein
MRRSIRNTRGAGSRSVIDAIPSIEHGEVADVAIGVGDEPAKGPDEAYELDDLRIDSTVPGSLAAQLIQLSSFP